MSSGKREEEANADTDSDTTAPLSSPYHSSRVGSPELRVLHELLDELDTGDPTATRDRDRDRERDDQDCPQAEADHLLHNDTKAEQVKHTLSFNSFPI